MAIGNFNSDTCVARKIKQYASSGSPRNLVTDSPDGRTCARQLKILGAGSFTNLEDGTDADLGTFGPLAVGDTLEASVSEVTSADAAFIAYW
jgi:hypothetical protein